MSVHHRLVFDMPASAAVVFDSFHYHRWRPYWDSLVGATTVGDGDECPSVGVVSINRGAGWNQLLSMRTRFVSYQRPRLAAAVMEGQSFPFRRWAASMRHEALDAAHSRMIYTYTLEARWVWLEPVVTLAFERATRKRFARLQAFVARAGAEVRAWQHAKGLPSDEPAAAAVDPGLVPPTSTDLKDTAPCC